MSCPGEPPTKGGVRRILASRMMAPERLEMRCLPGVMFLTYPAYCTGQRYRQDFEEIDRKLHHVTKPFGLLHDLRWVHYYRSDHSLPYLEQARALAALGQVTRVAFVVDCGPRAHSFLNSFTWLSPVQPACIFQVGHYDKAVKWCSSDNASEPG